jgi:hypothetical protein
MAVDVEAAGIETVVVLPLLGHQGRPFGAIGFAWDERRSIDVDELAALRTIAELGARALERARASDERTRDARSLGRFAAALATAVTRPEVVDAVNAHVPAMLDTSEVSLAVAEGGRPLSSTIAGAVEAFAGGGTVVVPGDPSSAHVVVHDVAGHPSGVLSACWARDVEFDDALRARLSTIGELIGQTLERADLYDRDHRLVVSLQERVLGTVVCPAGAELATRYLPAAQSLGMGGDWFDCIEHDRGFSLVVGDVTGHGVDAVTAMAQLRTLIGGLVRAGEPLETLFARVDGMLDRRELLLASAEVFDVDVSTWTLRYCSAGHPWALVRRADGEVLLLEDGQQALIGAPPRHAPAPALSLAPGDVLVAYTDGLVERRGEAITTGIQRLASCLREAQPGVELDALADAVLRSAGLGEMPPGGLYDLHDDVALLLLRRPLA